MRKLSLLWISPAEAVFFITLILIVIGTLNVFSASFVLAGQLLNDSYFFLKRHISSFLLGMICLFISAKLDYRKIPRRLPVYLIIVVGALIAVYFTGIDANGARRWLRIGITFQPSELAKLAAIFAAAAYLGPRLEKCRKITLVSSPVMITVFMGLLVLKQPDMGTASVIVGICLLMYVLAGIPQKEQLGLGVGASFLTVYLVYAASYRAERIMAWINPWAYQETTGYQMVQSLMAIGSGGFFGTGLGMGASKFYYLPEAHTDFAFAVLCQEMGFAGAIVVIFLFAALGFYGLKIALQATDGFGLMLGVGSTALVVGQAVGNIAMVSGLIPVTGVPLPFISYGGTSLIVNLIAIGILISISRYSSVTTDKKPNWQERFEARRKLRLVKQNDM